MKSKTKKKRKGFDAGKMRCPYCGGKVTLRSADGIYKDNSKGIMLYVCSHYPECDAYVRTHAGTNIPVGSMANGKLRALRIKAHNHFDRLYKTDIMSKQEAYKWLADLIGSPMSEAHIGHLGEYYCNEVIKKTSEIFVLRSRKTSDGLSKEVIAS
jgi:ssDNA-binding Zn-finger/Zn-ribbon topoisomerase 1